MTGAGPAFYPEIRPRRPIYLSGVDCAPLRALEADGYDVGLLTQPATYRAERVLPYGTWALDNGCYSQGDTFDPAARIRWLASFPDPEIRFGNNGADYESRLTNTWACPHVDTWAGGLAYGCLFATAPDVVCDMAATWARSQPWLATIRRLGFPVALVAQNGLESFSAAWDEIDAWDCLFIGGDDAWKESAAAATCAREARLYGKWVHVGRVNTRRRLQRMAGIADSVDGTYLAYGPDVNAARLARWLDELATPSLFEHAPGIPA